MFRKYMYYSPKVVCSGIKYSEGKMATKTQIVQARNVTLPVITTCFANYTNN